MPAMLSNDSVSWSELSSRSFGRLVELLIDDPGISVAKDGSTGDVAVVELFLSTGFATVVLIGQRIANYRDSVMISCYPCYDDDLLPDQTNNKKVLTPAKSSHCLL